LTGIDKRTMMEPIGQAQQAPSARFSPKSPHVAGGQRNAAGSAHLMLSDTPIGGTDRMHQLDRVIAVRAFRSLEFEPDRPAPCGRIVRHGRGRVAPRSA
jgi:hypothetical protein